MIQKGKQALIMGGWWLVLVLVGCTPKEADSINVYLDVPIHGISLPLAAVNIEGHTAGSGITGVEIRVNETVLTTIPVQPGDDNLSYFTYSWLPEANGEYTLAVFPIGADDLVGSPDTARITIGSTPTPPVTPSDTPTQTATITPTPEITFTPTLTLTATLTPTLPALVEFWADPAELDAGDCTTIRWHAENVASILFGGIEQPFDGSYEDCLCETQRYSLTVNYPDGSSEKKQITIPVEGACSTPTPEEDGPPDVPDLQVPADGASIGCKAKQSLVWLPVDDMSGISSYRVEVQKSSDGSSWSAAPGSPITVSDKSTSISVECGYSYRWRVRAVDGVGNTGSYSGWSEFTISLE